MIVVAVEVVEAESSATAESAGVVAATAETDDTRTSAIFGYSHMHSIIIAGDRCCRYRVIATAVAAAFGIVHVHSYMYITR
jgi:urease accessory protein UreF